MRDAWRRMSRLLVAGIELALLAGILGGALIARSPAGAPPAGPPAALSPATAAAALRAALVPGAGGVSFRVIQQTSVHARPGGPLLDLVDPADPATVIGQTDQLEQASYVERGGVSAEGFWMEMRDGPATPDAQPDFANAPYEYGTIVKDGKTYRDDGAGWYPTDQPPGIGIDPATAALLPQLLGKITKSSPLDPVAVDGKAVRQLAATADIADIPGLLAVDAASFTELTGPIEYGFDDAGRVVRLHAVVRNTRIEDWDYLVDVVITFGYGDAGSIPDPVPALPASGSKG
jgi:hypothetical protein